MLILYFSTIINQQNLYTMENTKNKQLIELQIKNRVKYNFFRTLNSGDFRVDIPNLNP